MVLLVIKNRQSPRSPYTQLVKYVCLGIPPSTVLTDFSVKGQLANILGFASCIVSLAVTQLCHCSSQEAIDTTQMSRAMFK